MPTAQRREAREALTFVHDVIRRIPVSQTAPHPAGDGLSDGEACVLVPDRVEALFPDASESWEWQFVFPAARRRKDGRTGRSVRVSADPSRVETTIAAVESAETRIFRLR